jgi:hypothetical protein
MLAAQAYKAQVQASAGQCNRENSGRLAKTGAVYSTLFKSHYMRAKLARECIQGGILAGAGI